MRGFIESLNDYSGFFSLLAVLAAVFVPIAIYKWERKNERQAMKEFNKRIANYQETLTKQFEESHKLESEIMQQLNQLSFVK